MTNPETHLLPVSIDEEFKNYLHWLHRDLSTKAHGSSEAGFNEFTFYKVGDTS